MLKKRIFLILLVILFLFFVSCTRNESAEKAQNEEVNEKTEVSIYLWDKDMSKELTPWLEEKFPQYDISFVVAHNNMDYYKDLMDRTGELPDIITCRRFSLNDAASLSDHLLDLSSTEIAGTIYHGYLEYNREADGAVRWLPMCAVIDGYVANIDLFEKYGIPVPTDAASFAYAIEEFEKRGIRGFATDFNHDYTCLELLQGSSIPLLSSLEGMIWRSTYESGVKDDEKGTGRELWREVFSAFGEYLSVIKPKAQDNNAVFSDIVEGFRNGETAIIRATAHDSRTINATYGMNTAMLPYFGETENDSWILTYPMFQVAVSDSVSKSPEKYSAVKEILSALFSEEGQKKAAAGSSVLSYSKTVEIPSTPVLRYITPTIEKNHLYIRLASTEMFSLSKKVVQPMVSGELGPEEAYEEFFSLLSSEKESTDEEVVFVQEKEYSLSFGDGGIEAASSLLNTMRSGAGTELALAYGPFASFPVVKGEYTSSQLKWLLVPLNSRSSVISEGLYTGEEIIRMLKWLINTTDEGSNPIRHKQNLPVVSGMEYSIHDNGDLTYTLLDVFVDGKPIEKDREYSLIMFGNEPYIVNPEYCDCSVPSWLVEKRKEGIETKKVRMDYVMEGIGKEGSLLPPSSYIEIKK